MKNFKLTLVSIVFFVCSGHYVFGQCPQPEILEDLPLEVCQNENLDIEVVGLDGAVYTWSVSQGGTLLNPPSQTNMNTFRAANAGQYTVSVTQTVESDPDACTESQPLVIGVEVNAGPTITTHPMGATYCVNDPATAMNVTATGPGLTYQWYSNTMNNNMTGVQISGATSASYTPPTTQTGTRYYYVIVTNNLNCSTTSNTATIVVNARPTITTHPMGATYCVNDPATTMSVTATGPGLTYQWYSNTMNNNMTGVQISGATSASYTPPTTQTGTRYYYVIVTNNLSCSTTSNTATIVVNARPTITTHPMGATYCVNDPATAMNVTATGPGLTYQWYSNTSNNNMTGVQISGATSASYTPPTTQTGTMYYYVIVTNNLSCSTTSNTATIVVNARPTITTHPMGATYCVNDPATAMNVTATGPGLTYQWYSNTMNNNMTGVQISGATSASYTPPTTQTGTMYYYVIVTNNLSCSTTSNTATIVVNARPTITTHPMGATYCVNDPATAMNVTATGPGLTYQWYSNTMNNNMTGVQISGATSASYTPPTTQTGTMYYYVIVTNNLNCSTTSNTATIVVNARPTITTHPMGATYCVNDPATAMNVTATGPGLTYQWYSNTMNNNMTGMQISGATSASYTPPTTQTGTMYYYVIVTNNLNCSTTSNTATIIVNARPTLTPGTLTNPTICGGTNGSIQFTTTNITSGSYQLNFKRNGVDMMRQITISTNNQCTLNMLASGSYSDFSITNNNNCTGVLDTTITLSEPNPPAMPSVITVSPDILCGPNTNITLSVDPVSGASFNWSVNPPDAVGNPSGNSTNTYNFTALRASQTYNVSVTAIQNNCTSEPRTTSFRVHPTPSLNISGPTTICEREDEVLNADVQSGTFPYSYTWNLNGMPISHNNPNYNLAQLPNGNHTFRVTVTDTNSCSSTTTKNVEVLNVPRVNIDTKERVGSNGIKIKPIITEGQPDEVSNIVYSLLDENSVTLITIQVPSFRDTIISGLENGKLYYLSYTVHYNNNCQFSGIEEILINPEKCEDFRVRVQVNGTVINPQNDIYQVKSCEIDSLKLSISADENSLKVTRLQISKNSNIVLDTIQGSISNTVSNPMFNNIDLRPFVIDTGIHIFSIFIRYTSGVNNSLDSCNYLLRIQNDIYPRLTLLTDSLCFISNQAYNLEFLSNVSGFIANSSPSDSNKIIISTNINPYPNENNSVNILVTGIKANDNICPAYSDTFTLTILRTPEIELLTDWCRNDSIRPLLTIDPKDSSAVYSIFRDSILLGTQADEYNGLSFVTTGIIDLIIRAEIDHQQITCRDSIEGQITVRPLPHVKIDQFPDNCGPFFQINDFRNRQDTQYDWLIDNHSDTLNISPSLIAYTGNSELVLEALKDGCYNRDTIVDLVSSYDFAEVEDNIAIRNCGDTTSLYFNATQLESFACFQWLFVDSRGNIDVPPANNVPWFIEQPGLTPILIKSKNCEDCEGTIVRRVREVNDDCDEEVKTIADTTWRVYPVPTFNYLNISSEQFSRGSHQFEIIDVVGRLMGQLQLYHEGGPMDILLDVSDYKAGMYFIRHGQKINKFIVIK
jgi:hypothetical protein